LTLAVSAYAQSDLEAKTKSFKNNKRFQVTYDRFKDRTWVTAGPFIDRVNITASFTFEGERQTRPISDVMLILDSHSNTWRFLNNRDLYAIVDGERLELGEGRRTGYVSTGYRSVGVTERLIFDVPLAVFEKFSTAKSVELKVGFIEFALKNEHVIAFRDLLSLLQK
jgi:hypothetical protein